MADLFGDILASFVQLAFEGTFTGLHGRRSSAASLAALTALLGGIGLLIAAIVYRNEPVSDHLLGAACVSGSVFLVAGVVAAFYASRRRK